MKALDALITKNEQAKFHATAGFDFKEAERLEQEIEEAKGLVEFLTN